MKGERNKEGVVKTEKTERRCRSMKWKEETKQKETCSR